MTDSGDLGGVKSIDRAFELLEALAAAGGRLSISELVEQSGLPMTTIHRLLRTLVRSGYVRQEPSKIYTLGPRMIHLGVTASKLLGSWSRPYLTRIAEATGETTSLAVLDADQVFYVAQVPSRHHLRMTTEVGRRLPPHCTAAGKALLTQAPDGSVPAALERMGLARHTARTITDPGVFLHHLELVRAQGYAVDDGECEVGVRCLAVPVAGGERAMAISVSAPEARFSLGEVATQLPLLQRVAAELAAALADPTD